MKNFVKEFKEFISKGNVLDLAVGIIIGGAFTAIVSSLVDDIIMPLIGIIFGGIDFSGLSATVGDTAIAYGSFIQAVIDFILVALVIFIFIKAVNRFKKKKEEEEPAKPAEDVALLTEIRDLLKVSCGAEEEAKEAEAEIEE